MKKVLGFVGRAGAGKGTACNYLRQKYGAGYHRFSEIIQQLTDELALPATRDNLIRMSEAVRREFGEEVLATAMNRAVEKDPAEIVCVDGVRRVSDLLSRPDFILIHITAAPKTRWQRICQRGEKPDDAGKTQEQFLVDEARSTEVSIDEVAKKADFTIVNDGAVEELYSALDKLIV